jgi:two-component system, NarL family, invasion response regulator UvrY
MEKVTVMIIDDHALIRDAWTMLLSKDDRFQITEKIGDPEKVEEKVRKNQPNLILLDINMGPKDGFEVLELIKKYSPNSRVIAVSMHDQTIYVKRMMKGGAKGYITKNSSAQELLHGIEVVMKGGRYICKEVKNALATQMLEGERSKINKLTAREIQIIKCLREGLSSKEVATKLSLTVKTVEVHRHNILKKLEVKNSIAAIEIANAYGL